VFLENRDGSLVTVNVLDLQPTVKDDYGYMALCDVDQDRDLDVVATIAETGEVRIFRNDGQVAGFVEPAAEDVIPVGESPLGVDAGDFDQDGRIDLVVGCSDARAIHVLMGTGGGSFQALPPLSLPFAPLNITCADFDDDGNLDVASTARYDDADSTEAVTFLAGDGTGALQTEMAMEIPSVAGGLGVGDVDEDGRLDLVAGQFALATDEMVVYLNRGGFHFVEDVLSISPGPGTPLVVDADQDGHLDVLVLTTDGELKMTLGDGSGSFAQAEPRTRGELPCPEGTVSAASVDLDGDHLSELLMVSPSSPFVWVATNTSFEAPMN
jgi:VCBS repeat protein